MICKKRKPVFIIAEVGINHNGNIEIAKKLIDIAIITGCDAVKFQKRNIDIVYTQEYLNSPRESPWGITNREQKKALEFGFTEYTKIDKYCKQRKIPWFASVWDIYSLKFIEQFNVPFHKVASAMLSNLPLIKEIAMRGKYTFISTGMHDMEDIAKAVNIFRKYKCPFELMYCVSTYPCSNEEVDLSCIKTLKDTFKCDVGYSGHERGIQISTAAVALGATSVERHVTLDRTLYGSDQAASLELGRFSTLVRDIRIIERCMGSGKKKVLESELPIKRKLCWHLNK